MFTKGDSGGPGRPRGIKETKPRNTPIADGKVRDRMNLFLEAYVTCGTLKGAREATGCSRSMITLWNKANKFHFTDRLLTAQSEFADYLEGLALDRLLHPSGNRGSDLLLITLLNANRPQKYRARYLGEDPAAKEMLEEWRAFHKMQKEKQQQAIVGQTTIKEIDTIPSAAEVAERLLEERRKAISVEAWEIVEEGTGDQRPLPGKPPGELAKYLLGKIRPTEEEQEEG